MNYYLFIPLGIVLLAFIPVKIKVRISFNLLERTGALGIFIYKFKLQQEQFWLQKKKILIKKDDEVESREIEFNSKEVLFLKTFASEIKDKTRIKDISVFYNLGLQDAFLSAMGAGYINLALYAFFGYLKSLKPTASFGIYDTISYNKKVCQFAATGVFSISLFDVAYSLLNSVILSKKIHEKGAE